MSIDDGGCVTVFVQEYKSSHPYYLVMVLVHGHPPRRIEPLQEVLGPLGHGNGVLDDLLLQCNALLDHPIPQDHGIGNTILPQWLDARRVLTHDDRNYFKYTL
jgi:hypothetical protein